MGWAGRLGVAAVVCVTFAGPAWAGPTDTPPAWEPPPVNMAALPGDPAPGPPPGVTYVQQNQCVTSLGDDNRPLPGEPAAQSMLDIQSAQQFTTGTGVKVAVIDTGVNPNPLLTDHGRLKPGGDYLTPKTSDGTVDCDGHGTLTAGIVAANTAHTGDGFIGVAPGATIYAIRQTSGVYIGQKAGNQSVPAGTPSSLAAAIVHAVRLGVGVITTSVDTCLPADVAEAAMRTPGSPEQQLQAAVTYAIDHNVVVVNSAGNTSTQPEGGSQQPAGDQCAGIPQNDHADPNDVREIEFPAVFSDDLLSVASVSPATGSVSKFSVWGPWVNIAAPGEGIVSVNPAVNGRGLAQLFAEPGSNSQPGPIQGTSFAAPYVAGVVALVRARFPRLTARQVIARVEATAQHPTGPGGRNNQIGYGIINPVAALTEAVPGQNGVPSVGDSSVPVRLPEAHAKDWTPVRVALAGSGVAVALLLVTYFAVRTVRRRRPGDPL
ncbi:MAG TPA: type VII secretion-associated serine protease mycosin [Pseudonocardiaceae bacterium]|nr:type VII secretion-associated serine protease mycosin [Pseudonocardiaceae bacterium]